MANKSMFEYGEILLGGIVFLALVVFVYYGIPYFFELWNESLIAKRARNKKAIALTFDDGPGSRLTPAILRLLNEHNTKATFFLLGRNIPGRETTVRQIASGEHQICSHGYEHLNHWKVSPFRALADIKLGWRTINEALGTNGEIYPFRPPYGKLNIVSLIYLLYHRVPIIYWSLDSGDTAASGRFDEMEASELISQHGGGILLAHDFDRATNAIDEKILMCISSILSMAKVNGITVFTCSELLQRGKK